jgi:hypothetical protein
LLQNEQKYGVGISTTAGYLVYFMRSVLLCVMCVVNLANWMPFLKSNSVSSFPEVNGFIKNAYSRIEDADVKSLTSVMLESYRDLCVRYGAWVVSRDVQMIYESHNVDLKISVARLGKLGSLLRRLEELIDTEDENNSPVGNRDSMSLP